MIWGGTQENYLSKLARDVWLATLFVQFWRTSKQAGKPYRLTPRAFRISDVAKALNIPESKLKVPFNQLERANMLRLTDDGPWFATTPTHLVVPPHVRTRILSMFDQLHPKTRDKPIAIPRRLLKIMIQCRRKTVRLATLLGLLMRIMLEKRKHC